jgi:uncharacterized protein YeaO (DUF488 family)
MAASVTVGRVYDEPDDAEGVRVLVDRIWPRGLAKERARLDDWCRAVAPSTGLRQWYAHDAERFPEFVLRYEAELAEPERADALRHLEELAASGPLLLLTATKRLELSHAQVLAQLLRR